MERQKQVIITMFLLVAVVFVLGVVLGNSWKSADSSEVGKILRSSELDAESFRVEQELFKSFESNCELAKTRLGKGAWGKGRAGSAW